MFGSEYMHINSMYSQQTNVTSADVRPSTIETITIIYTQINLYTSYTSTVGDV